MVKATIKDVAAEAGVSVGTASRVINQFAEVSPELKRRVDLAIQKLGYAPDAAARSLRLRSSRTVGILISDFSPPAFAAFATVAQSVLFKAGYVPLLAGYNDEPERELQILRAFAQRRIDGLILTTSSDSDDMLVAARRSLDVPTILFDRDPDNGEDMIAIDHRHGIQEAMAYLFGLGHRRIALVTGQMAVRSARERIAAFKKAYLNANLQADNSLLRSGGFSESFAYEQALDLLAMPDPPTAIIGGGINLLPGLLQAVRSLGLRIPHDVSIVGSTNPEIVELVTPTITELQVDYSAIGVKAATLMLGRVEGTVVGPPRILRFETRLVLRDSCSPPKIQRARKS